jgi:DNA-binding NtrC family response regulator
MQSFLHRFCVTSNRPVLKLSDELRSFLEHYSWPGNIRELRNTIESMTVMGGDSLGIADLPPDLHASATKLATEQPGAATATSTLDDLEKKAVVQALERVRGNRTRAAEALGISVRTLQRKLKQWGLAAGEEV